MVLFFMQVWCATTALGYTTNTLKYFFNILYLFLYNFNKYIYTYISIYN
jgi:hypothetical protein